MYTKKLMKYFRKPKNAGRIKNADGIGEAGNPLCGDMMRMYIKIEERGTEVGRRRIVEAKFETLGCAAAIAMSDRVIEMILGKTVEAAKKLRPADIALGFDLPKNKIHCSVLGMEALKEAIKDYEKKLDV